MVCIGRILLTTVRDGFMVLCISLCDPETRFCGLTADSIAGMVGFLSMFMPSGDADDSVRADRGGGDNRSILISGPLRAFLTCFPQDNDKSFSWSATGSFHTNRLRGNVQIGRA